MRSYVKNSKFLFGTQQRTQPLSTLMGVSVNFNSFYVSAHNLLGPYILMLRFDILPCKSVLHFVVNSAHT